MNRPSEWDRRTYLRGLAAAGIVGSVPVAASAAHDYDDERGPPDDDERGPPHDDERDPSHEIPDARPFIGDLDGLNADLDDGVGDMAFHVKNRYYGDPDPDADPEDRAWPLHYTTEGVETQDYPAALINIQKRLDKRVTLGDLQDDKAKFSFDFFVGKKHKHYIPGQVYLVIQTKAHKEQAEEGERQPAAGLFKNVRKGGERKQWRELDVVQEMSSEGTDAPWHYSRIELDPDGFQGDFETLSDAVLEQAVVTRDEGETIEDVFEWDEDSRLLAFGLGSGSSRSASVRDIYFDNFRLHVKDQEYDEYQKHSFDIPAALEMDGDVRRNGQIIARFSLPPDQEGVDLADVDEDSIRLYPFSQIAPPHSEGAAPARVIVSDDEVEARFPPGRARDLPGLSGGDRWVTVAGTFDYEHGVWFFGSGQVRIPGN